MKKKRMVWLIIVISIPLLLFSTYQVMNARTFQFFGGLTSSVDTDQKVVALTFDDGPTKNVDNLLALLDKYEVKATFFLIGNEIVTHPEEAKRIVEAGHQIGNHSYSHERMIFKSPSFIKKEIEKTNESIRKIGYTEQIDFRPPNGKKLLGLPFYLSKENIDTIMWNLEPDTYHSTTSEKVTYVKENIKPGSIILLHPMYEETSTDATEEIIQLLVAEDYTFATVDELKKLQSN